MTGYVYRIDRRQTADGPGNRTAVLLKGCPMRCVWCDSPQTLHMEPELIYRPDQCITCLACLDDCRVHAIGHAGGEPVVDAHACRWCGDCADHCPTDARVQAGSVMTESRVLEMIEEDAQAFAGADGGVTFSGGEPLQQPEFLIRLLEGCRSRGIHTAVETCGHAPREVVARVADRTDLFLYDVKHLDDASHRQMTGLSNRQILANLTWLAGRGSAVVVRLPIVPGLNDDEGYLSRAGEYVAGLGIRRIELMPYHAGEAGAFQARRQALTPAVFVPPSAERVDEIARTLRSRGLDVELIGRL